MYEPIKILEITIPAALELKNEINLTTMIIANLVSTGFDKLSLKKLEEDTSYLKKFFVDTLFNLCYLERYYNGDIGDIEGKSTEKEFKDFYDSHTCIEIININSLYESALRNSKLDTNYDVVSQIYLNGEKFGKYLCF